MEFDTKQWVKPFSTGMACLDTITGDCPRGLSKESCKKMCEDSFQCDYGYHVEMPNVSKSYCVPLSNLVHWDYPPIFEKSTIRPTESSILHPSLGVKVTPFMDKQATQVDPQSVYDITQLGVYLLQYFPPASSTTQGENNRTLLYMYDDLTFGPEVDKAVQLVLFKVDPVPSSVSTKDPTIRNGNVIFLKNHDNNRVVLHISPTDFGFMPYSLRVSSSTSYDVNDLFHTQIVTKYPFTYDPVTQNDKFAIRVAQIPVQSLVYYWTVDATTMKLTLAEVARDQIERVDLSRFANFQLDKIDEIDIRESENFALSQQRYLYDNYQAPPDQRRPSNPWVYISLSLVLIMFLVVAMYRFVHLRK